MKTFINVLEEKMKPPFKYFLLPQGCFRRGSYTSAVTLKEAKKKAEEFVIEFKSPIQILKVFYNDNEERLGYMGKRILILDRDFNWEKDITDDLCLHVAFFYKDCCVRQWNPDLYDKLRKDWDNELKQKKIDKQKKELYRKLKKNDVLEELDNFDGIKITDKKSRTQYIFNEESVLERKGE